MREVILILVSVGLSFMVFKLTEKDESQNVLDHYIIKQEQKKIDEALDLYNQLENHVYKLDTFLLNRYEKIDSVDKPGFRDLFNDWDGRAN